MLSKREGEHVLLYEVSEQEEIRPQQSRYGLRQPTINVRIKSD